MTLEGEKGELYLIINKMYDFDIYTDGGYSRLYNKGAWAYVILRNGQIITMDSKGESFATNNQMEIKGVIEAISNLPEGCSALIHSDSQYTIGVLGNPHWKPKKNLGLIRQFHAIRKARKLSLSWRWVKGHSGDTYNEMCDQMCDSAAGMDLNAEYHSNKERKRSSLSDMSDETIEDLYNILLNERERRNGK